MKKHSRGNKSRRYNHPLPDEVRKAIKRKRRAACKQLHDDAARGIYQDRSLEIIAHPGDDPFALD